MYTRHMSSPKHLNLPQNLLEILLVISVTAKYVVCNKSFLFIKSGDGSHLQALKITPI